MPLSSDPEKRARSLANLRKGPAAAAKTFGLEVVDYDEPDQAPPPKAPKSTPTPRRKAPPEPATGAPSTPAPAGAGSPSGPSMLLIVGGGLALLLVLVLVLNHMSPRV